LATRLTRQALKIRQCNEHWHRFRLQLETSAARLYAIMPTSDATMAAGAATGEQL